MVTLTVEKRDAAVKPAAVRRSGAVPAVVYGGHQESTPISVDARIFEKVLKDAGESTIISLEGLGQALPVLIHQVDLDPLTSLPQHVDFYAVTKGEKVSVAIPLSFIGTSAAVKAGANLVKVLYEVEVKADPMNLPSEIEVDLTVLEKIDDQIHAKDLALPSGVELDIDPDEVVVLTQAVAEEEEQAEAADISSVEVEKKGKTESEEGAA